LNGIFPDSLRLGTYLRLLFVFVVATFGVAFRLRWIGGVPSVKIKINGKLIEIVSCGMNPKEWIMGGDCWIDNRFYPGITPSG
jgi:hypothetical protein